MAQTPTAFLEIVSDDFPSTSRDDSVIRVYDADGNVIETHEHKGDFKEPRAGERKPDRYIPVQPRLTHWMQITVRKQK